MRFAQQLILHRVTKKMTLDMASKPRGAPLIIASNEDHCHRMWLGLEDGPMLKPGLVILSDFIWLIIDSGSSAN